AISRTGSNVHRPPARSAAVRPDAPAAGTRPQLALQIGHSDRVTAVASTHDSQTLITAGADKTVRIWDLREGELKAIIPLTEWNPLAAALSPDGRLLAITDWGRIRLWDVKSGRLRATLPSNGASNYLAFSPDGKILAG